MTVLCSQRGRETLPINHPNGVERALNWESEDPSPGPAVDLLLSWASQLAEYFKTSELKGILGHGRNAVGTEK